MDNYRIKEDYPILEHHQNKFNKFRVNFLHKSNIFSHILNKLKKKNI
jgi:hypothetical protein